MKHVVVTGSLAFDYIMDFPQSFEENILPEKLHTLSVSFLAHNFSKNFGGTAGNITYNLGLLNQKPLLLASAGANDFKPYEQHLEGVSVNTSYIRKVEKEFSANMFMITDKNNCQIAGFYPGAMEKDDTLSIKNMKADFVVVAPTTPSAMGKFVKEAKAANIPYLYDPAQQIPRLSKEQLINGIDGASILIGNDYELAMLTKKTGFSKNDIKRKSKIVITTLGSKGSLIEEKGKQYSIGTVNPKKIVDPTGAGDAYIAGFLSGFLQNSDLKTAGQIAATAATYAIEHYGTQNHRFSLDDFKERYRQAFGETVKW
ncbi:MAG: carbohydrate kinase family protein [Candidatus Levybacteria bacterium]|nr:carbohydrate kinase family protein [Candidatus Levybacteria bacterium]